MPADATPQRGIVVVTCMDARLDALAILGLRLGDAHVLRNAGGRVTDDVLRSVTLSVGGFGTRSIVVMEHTECGAEIGDHRAALRADVERLAAAPELATVESIEGLLYDVDSGDVDELVRWRRSSVDHLPATSGKHGVATLLR